MEESCGEEDDAQSPVGEVLMDLEDSAVTWLAVPQVGERDAEEIVEAVSAGVVAVIGAAVTVQTQVPLSCKREK